MRLFIFGPIVVMNLQRENAVLENRKLMGATKPLDAEEGTLRKKYGISIDKNSVHGSDSVENARIELDFSLKISYKFRNCLRINFMFNFKYFFFKLFILSDFKILLFFEK